MNQNNHYSANDVIASTLLVTIRHIFLLKQTNAFCNTTDIFSLSIIKSFKIKEIE